MPILADVHIITALAPVHDDGRPSTESGTLLKRPHDPGNGFLRYLLLQEIPLVFVLLQEPSSLSG